MDTSRITLQCKMVTGLFNDRASAERAYKGLHARGYGRGDVNLVMSDDMRTRSCKNMSRGIEERS